MDDQNKPTLALARATEPTPTTSPSEAPILAHPDYQPNPVAAIAEELAPELEPQTVALTPEIPAPVTEPTTLVGSRPVEKQPNLLWLWISLGIVFFIGLAIVAVFFVSKEAADKQADAYTKATTSYVDKVYTDVNAASTASDAKKALDTDQSTKPILKTEFLSSFSGKYTTAKTLQVTVDNEMATFTKGINELAGVDSFTKLQQGDFDKITKLAGTVTAVSGEAAISAVLKDMLTIVTTCQTRTETAVFPSELQQTKTDLALAYKNEAKYTQALIDTLKLKDTAGYAAASNGLNQATQDETTAVTSIQKFYNSLATKRNDLLTKLDSFKKDLV